VDDLPAPPARIDRVHGAYHPATDDHDPFHGHRPSIVVRVVSELRRRASSKGRIPRQLGLVLVPGRLNWRFARSGVAQLAARMILVHEVGGSSPPPRADALSQREDTVTELIWQ
jgi:hypothetical protein